MDGVQWDDANRNHIARHDVSVAEVEDILADEPVELPAQYDGNEVSLSWVGETITGRVLLVAFTERGDDKRPVTAYEPSTSIKQRYFRARSGQ